MALLSDILGGASDQDIEGARLDDKGLAIYIVDRERDGLDREIDGFGFTGPEVNALEIGQLLDGLRHAAFFLVDVELYDFVACDPTGVLDIDGHGLILVGSDGGRGDF